MAVTDNQGRRNAGSADLRLEVAQQTLVERMYYQLHLVREVEKKMARIAPERLVTQLLQEAWRRGDEAVCDVGVLNAIDATRHVVFPTCRADIHLLIHSDNVLEYVARNRHRVSTSSAGDDSSRRSNALRLSQEAWDLEHWIGSAMNAALTSKLNGSDATSVVFLGDGISARQQLNQSFGVAALWSLPILFVLSTSLSAPSGYQQAQGARDAASVADEADFASHSIMADDVLKVYAFASAAMAYVHRSCQPFVLQLETFCSRTAYDDGAGPFTRRAWSRKGDPLWKLAQKLTSDELMRVEELVADRVAFAFQAVEGCGAMESSLRNL